MINRLRVLLGISVFWLALSLLFDGLTALVLPRYLLGQAESSRATTLGLLTFVGLLAGMLVQPLAGAWSDRLRPRWGRRGTLALGVGLILVALAIFGVSANIVAIVVGYVLVQITASVAQAAQQGFIPDLIPPERRGTAAGWKGLMDLGGSMLGFVVLGQLLGESVRPALLAIAAVLLVMFGLTVSLVRETRQSTTSAQDRVTLRDAFRIDLQQHRAFGWLIASRFLFLLGTYAVGRFLLFFVADRLGLDPGRAAEQAGALLGGLTLITGLAAIPGGWAADRWGRLPLMLIGALLSATGTLLLIVAGSAWHILIFGGLMALGSAAFTGANWAMTADLVPPAEAARFFGIANIGTAGAAAAAGLFGPLVDWGNTLSRGTGYALLFIAATLAFVASAVVLRQLAPSRAGTASILASESSLHE